MMKVAKAYLDSSLENFEDAVHEYEEMEDAARVFSGEDDSELAITEKIAHQTRIAKVINI